MNTDYLIISGANVNLRLQTKKKNTMLIFAASKGHGGVVEVLLDHGADWQLRQEETEATALHIAAKKGHLDIILILTKRGVPVHVTSASAWQPLHYASIHGRVDVMDLLLKLYVHRLVLSAHFDFFFFFQRGGGQCSH